MTTDTEQPGVEDSGNRIVELYVLQEVYAAAFARARRVGQPISAVARQIVYQAGVDAVPPKKPVELPPNYQIKRGKTKRVRFTMPPEEYEIAVRRIEATGVLVGAALEDGLETYARTGRYAVDPEIAEHNRALRTYRPPVTREAGDDKTKE